MSFRKIHKLSTDVQKQLEKERLDLIESITGADGQDGKDGLSGTRGARGQQGERGEPGMNGVDGMNGRDGRDGVDGKDGKDGKDGEDGRGVERMYIASGYLYVVYTDGETVKLGLVVGKSAGTTAFISDTNLNIRTSSATESLQVNHRDYIRQDTASITTTLTCNITGSKIYIKNVSGSSTTVGAVIDGITNMQLSDNESLTLVYNGTDFDIV